MIQRKSRESGTRLLKKNQNQQHHTKAKLKQQQQQHLCLSNEVY